MPIRSGIQAPDFSLLDENNTPYRLSDYHGQPVVLYFYPRDDTPGCTTEACAFRDDYSAYIEADLVILGVSSDSPHSHANLKKNIPCLSHYSQMMTTKYVKIMGFGD